MTEKELEAVIAGIVPVLREFVAKEIGGVTERMKALEADVLSSKAYLKDAGVWRHGSTYGAGDVATFKGSAWVCTKAHTAEGPVADHSYWRLLVKGSR